MDARAGRARAPTIGVVVDDLAAWVIAGHAPTGIQRVASELLDTAASRAGLNVWPMITQRDPATPGGAHLTVVDRDTLRWQSDAGRGRTTAIGLRLARAAARSLPIPSSVRAVAKGMVFRTALSQGVIGTRGDPGLPDLLLVPGAFWTGGTASRIVGLAASGIRLRTIVYDLFQIQHPEWFPGTMRDEFSAAADAVIPASERIVTLCTQVAADIVDRYPETDGRVIVATPTLRAHAHQTTSGPASGSPPIVSGNFLLAVGTVEPRKNYRVVLDAWRVLTAQPGHEGHHLVIAGRRGFLGDEIEAEIARDGDRLRIHRLVGTTDEELEGLYATCSGTVNASWAEGLGLPVRESIARGVCTLVSTCIPTDGLPASSYFGFAPTDALGLAALMGTALAAGPVRRSIPLGPPGTGWEPILDALVSD